MTGYPPKIPKKHADAIGAWLMQSSVGYKKAGAATAKRGGQYERAVENEWKAQVLYHAAITLSKAELKKVMAT